MAARTLRARMLAHVLVRPRHAFAELAESEPTPASVFFRFALWLSVLPPLFNYIGTSRFGWRLGVTDPLFLPPETLVQISIAYFASLLFGFFSAALVSRWMAATYGARDALGVHFAMMVVVGAPLAAASAVQLYPSIFLGVLVLVPAVLWSMYLLYRGLPRVLHTTPEQGMLMASSLIGYLLVAVVSLLGVTVLFWVLGVGPALGV